MEELVRDVLARRTDPAQLDPKTRAALQTYLKDQAADSRRRASAARDRVAQGERDLDRMGKFVRIAAGVFGAAVVMILTGVYNSVFGSTLPALFTGGLGIALMFAVIPVLHFALPPSQRNLKARSNA